MKSITSSGSGAAGAATAAILSDRNLGRGSGGGGESLAVSGADRRGAVEEDHRRGLGLPARRARTFHSPPRRLGGRSGRRRRVRGTWPRVAQILRFELGLRLPFSSFLYLRHLEY